MFFSVFRYTLQGGYDKQITLPNSEEAEDLESKVVVPKHVDHMLPLSESMLSSSNVGLIGDFALFMSRCEYFAKNWKLFQNGKKYSEIFHCAKQRHINYRTVTERFYAL